MKKLLILGHARHGKDTVAELMRDRHGVSFRGSSLFLTESCVRPHLATKGIHYGSTEECYADRVNHRSAWRHAIVEYNSNPQRLAREILAEADAYVGMRSAREYAATKDLFDQIFWVDASDRGLPPESKSSMDIEFDPVEMILINNSGTLEELAEAVDAALKEPSW